MNATRRVACALLCATACLACSSTAAAPTPTEPATTGSAAQKKKVPAVYEFRITIIERTAIEEETVLSDRASLHNPKPTAKEATVILESLAAKAGDDYALTF